MGEARRTDRTRRTGVALAAGLAVAALAACTTSGPEEPSPDPSVSESSTSPSPSATSPSPEPTASSASPSPSPSATTTLAGFSLAEKKTTAWPRLGRTVGIGLESRVGRQAGFDRVVYEFSRNGSPQYRVRYVDAPIEDGSGDRADVAGDTWLEVSIGAVDVPGESAPSPDDPLPATLEGTGIAAAPAIWGGFEGVGQQFIGVRGEQRPFRVSVLRDPMRLVVDIAR